MSYEPGPRYQGGGGGGGGGGYPPQQRPHPGYQQQQQQQHPPQHPQQQQQQQFYRDQQHRSPQQQYPPQEYQRFPPGGGRGWDNGQEGGQGYPPNNQGQGPASGYEDDLGNRFEQQMSFQQGGTPNQPMGPPHPQHPAAQRNQRQFHRPFAPQGGPPQGQPPQQFGGPGGPGGPGPVGRPPPNGVDPRLQGRSMTMPTRGPEDNFRGPPHPQGRPPFRPNGAHPMHSARGGAPMMNGPPRQRPYDEGEGYRDSVLDLYTDRSTMGHPQDQQQYGGPRGAGGAGGNYYQGGTDLQRSRSQPSMRDGPLPGQGGPPPPMPHMMPQETRGASFESQRSYGSSGQGMHQGPPQTPYGQRQNPQGSAPMSPASSIQSSRGPGSIIGGQAPYGGNSAYDNPHNGYGGQQQPQQMPQQGYNDPDQLPEHPPPTRPGHGPPPPQRQFTSPNPAPAAGSRNSSGPITHGELEILRGEARNNPNDSALQLRLAKKLIEASVTLADDGDPKSTKKNREMFIFEAHKTIKRLTTGAHPDPEAMFFLANCYGDGSLGLEVDHEKAFSLYQSSAKLNHPASAYRTAVCCEIGAGTRKDPAKAMQWYRKAAAIGDTAAMYKLGMILYKGLLGQPKSIREALSWLKRAADQADEDNPHAFHQLGLLYESEENNDYIIRDIDYARDLFIQAAELGYTPSQFKLGNAYAYGLLGCPVDARLSIAWYSRAAAKGDPESELALSGWYLTGAEGVLEQNDTEAYLWARKAAEKGLAKAEYGVGHFTELGIGLGGVGNEEEAKKWYFRAAGQGHQKSQERLQQLMKGGSKKQRERLSRTNKAKDDADCVVM